MLLNRMIWKYASALSSNESALLLELERQTHLKTRDPEMSSGKLQGRLLSFFSKMKKPKVILEIGTFTGYATLCLAEGLAEEGKIITIQKDGEYLQIARAFFEQSEYTEQIQLIEGDAIEIIPELNENLDLVFIDAGKKEYLEYYELLMAKLKPSSIILADNILWRGKVLDDSKDERTQILDAFNKRVCSDDRVENFILPFRDGIHVIMVK